MTRRSIFPTVWVDADHGGGGTAGGATATQPTAATATDVEAAAAAATATAVDDEAETDSLLLHLHGGGDDYGEANADGKTGDGAKKGGGFDSSDGAAAAVGGRFHVTNQETNQYWGRFNDPAVEARYDDAVDAKLPVATARPDDRRTRMAFIRKVYTILSAQLATTFAVCALIAFCDPVRDFILGTGGTGSADVGLFYWFNIILLFGTLIPLQKYKRTYPTNYILLSVFTVSMSTMVGTVTAIYADAGAGDLVMEAVAITASVFVILTIFTLQSKWDFSFLGAGLGMCLWVMILWGLFTMIFGVQAGYVYALAGSILFSGFIIYDTYLICERLDPEDYIVAAIELYLDLVNLFLYILRLLAESNRD